eukprot:2240316-Alexandrium_andersonii.AAC.1
MCDCMWTAHACEAHFRCLRGPGEPNPRRRGFGHRGAWQTLHALCRSVARGSHAALERHERPA